ncbi:unnamed protein product [Rotaria magnacalcarata]|uniref:F-box domain-containing protein n=1 Tax=Rotaria magnacalcarata TaxID=392030 RepID=A0A814WV05_9BILA|nr:unnamed protein product [Rotaria magnacalcarata]CAF1409110.1 unnamed protein product [Rotaria magnacalcarata]CAF1921114.1 unnamed protein product [Rotaria magnacalcarata]CAF2146423.1 unnamed protein product [Rotaria magnacalcarata]CAF3773111.1 unnamed protein product [Rotaria magnacalcarata]
MYQSNNNQFQLLDLPNEILFIILKKLNKIDALYSLVGVSQRLDQLLPQSLYIRNLDMISMTIKSFTEGIYSIDNDILSRICQDILSRIHHQINELIVEEHSMERVLHTMSYPQLRSLSLINFEEKVPNI